MNGLDALTIDLAPLLPWPVVAVLGGLAAVLVLYALLRRARGAVWRAIPAAVLVTALLNPSLIEERRDPLTDVAVLLVDDSPSQRLAGRQVQTEDALAELRRELEALPGIETRVVRAAREADDEGTKLFGDLTAALADVSGRRVAGVIALSDGQVHDVPGSLQELGFDAPVHLLLTGRSDEGDRRLAVTEAPSYGLVGKEIRLSLRVDDLPQATPGSAAVLEVSRDGQRLPPVPVAIGADMELPLMIEHAGPTVFELEVEAGPQELSLLNNRAVVVVNGVRDRLRVLLVSGEPYPGERSWRNLLKSDPSVDLVHFTILRPPEKQDGTPINELSLIAFPIRELFDLKLDEFDLIIFDRYRRRGVLPRAYFENIARYVEEGGALLESSGSAYAGPLSLYDSPLGRVLPGEPTGEVIDRGFRPTISEIGGRHPVTADLAPSDEPPGWGRWFRTVDAVVRRGVTVMDGVDGRPLLVLDRFGEGRVAQLLSDEIWLWGRGFEGGGPQADLLRRIAHWLMKEPELEEEDLRATVVEGRLEVTRRTLSARAAEVEVTMPSGATRRLALEDAGHGRWTAILAADEIGLYRVTDGTRTAFAARGSLNPREFADLRATPDLMAPIVEASGGAVHRIAESGIPDLRLVRPGRDTTGRDWIGLRRNDDYVVTGVERIPVLPGALTLLLALGAAMLAWWREGR
ncbi:MAG: membrane protein [Alphaproteobacteria bacterium]|nr:MAG: membrane protein [Alphaproteobacteria bacterium]